MLLLGFGFTAYLGIDKLFVHTSSPLISDRTEFYRINFNDSRIAVFHCWVSG